MQVGGNGKMIGGAAQMVAGRTVGKMKVGNAKTKTPGQSSSGGLVVHFEFGAAPWIKTSGYIKVVGRHKLQAQHKVFDYFVKTALFFLVDGGATFGRLGQGLAE